MTKGIDIEELDSGEFLVTMFGKTYVLKRWELEELHFLCACAMKDQDLSQKELA